MFTYKRFQKKKQLNYLFYLYTPKLLSTKQPNQITSKETLPTERKQKKSQHRQVINKIFIYELACVPFPQRTLIHFSCSS